MGVLQGVDHYSIVMLVEHLVVAVVVRDGGIRPHPKVAVDRVRDVVIETLPNRAGALVEINKKTANIYIYIYIYIMKTYTKTCLKLTPKLL